MEEIIYSGQTTLRIKVTGQPIMAESKGTFITKTQTTTTASGTTKWMEVNNAGKLYANISSGL